MKWVPPSLDVVVGIAQVGNTFSSSLFATVRASTLGQENFNPFRKHTPNNQNTLVIHMKRQLNEVQLQVLKGTRARRFETSGNR